MITWLVVGCEALVLQPTPYRLSLDHIASAFRFVEPCDTLEAAYSFALDVVRCEFRECVILGLSEHRVFFRAVVSDPTAAAAGWDLENPF